MTQSHRWGSPFCLGAAYAIALLSLTAAPGRAAEGTQSEPWLSADQIRSEFSGKPLAGIYPNQHNWTETINADGSTDYREGERHWKGQWWVENREFCFTYPAPGVGGCFRVVRRSANCFELYDFTGEAGQGETAPDAKGRWNGRMWHTDRPTTCEDPSV